MGSDIKDDLMSRLQSIQNAAARPAMELGDMTGPCQFLLMNGFILPKRQQAKVQAFATYE